MLPSAWLFRLGSLLLGWAGTIYASPVPVGLFPSELTAWRDWIVDHAHHVDKTQAAELWETSQLGQQPHYPAVHRGPPFKLEEQPHHYAGRAGPPHPSYPPKTSHTRAGLDPLRSSFSTYGAKKDASSYATQDDEDEYIQTLLNNASPPREAAWTVEQPSEPQPMQQTQQGRRHSAGPSARPEPNPITTEPYHWEFLDTNRFPPEVKYESLRSRSRISWGPRGKRVLRDSFSHEKCFPERILTGPANFGSPQYRNLLFTVPPTGYRIVRANDADRVLVQSTMQHRLDQIKGSVSFKEDPVAFFDSSVVVRDEKWVRKDLLWQHNHLDTFLPASKGLVSTIRINGYWLIFRRAGNPPNERLPDPGKPWILNHVTATSQGGDMFEVGYMWSNVDLKSVSLENAMTFQEP